MPVDEVAGRESAVSTTLSLTEQREQKGIQHISDWSSHQSRQKRSTHPIEFKKPDIYSRPVLVGAGRRTGSTIDESLCILLGSVRDETYVRPGVLIRCFVVCRVFASEFSF